MKFPAALAEQIETLARKRHQTVSDIIRAFTEKGLNADGYADKVDPIREVIRQEVDEAVKKQTNRIAALLNKNTILSASSYYATAAIITALIDQDRYTSFQKIERLARKRGLEYANTKQQDSLQKFMDDEVFTAAVEEIHGQLHERKTNPQKRKTANGKISLEDFDPLTDDPRDLDTDDFDF